MRTFTSPQTGTEYLVVERVDRRMVGSPLRWVEGTEYTVVLNGNPVQFCFREEDIPEAVSRYENPLTEEQYQMVHSVFD